MMGRARADLVGVALLEEADVRAQAGICWRQPFRHFRSQLVQGDAPRREVPPAMPPSIPLLSLHPKAVQDDDG
jgi:hypothetical protein